MKTALITGITGQDGFYLTDYLLKNNYKIHGTIRRSSLINTSRIDPLISEYQKSGRLKFLEEKNRGFNYYDQLGFEVMFVNGHTEKQMIPKFRYKNKDIVYVADLIPTAGHIPLPYLMGYDVRPLITMQEKSLFLKSAFKNGEYLFMEHDPYNEVVSLKNSKTAEPIIVELNINKL